MSSEAETSLSIGLHCVEVIVRDSSTALGMTGWKPLVAETPSGPLRRASPYQSALLNSSGRAGWRFTRNGKMAISEPPGRLGQWPLPRDDRAASLRVFVMSSEETAC